MDNSNNNGLEYDDNSDMSDKKPHRKGFRNGFGVGIATGIVTTIVLGLIVLFAYTMITGRSVHTVAKSADVLDDKTVQKIDELANYIDEYYYEDYDKDDLENGLLHGVMEGLNDPYSVYYTADEYKELQISTTGTYYGIGAALKQDPNTKQVTVSKVYSGTPSEEAGLKKDDEIVSVDGVEATSEDLTKLVAKIRGKEGTKVTLKIRRGEEADPFTVEVERKNVELPSVDSKLLDNGVGYIQVSEFQTNTASQFEDALDGLTNQGMKGLIVDLRANPGGLLTAVTEMVDRLLPAELVLIAAGFLGTESYVAKAFGVELNARTNVSTQEGHYATNVKNVYVAGDNHRGQSLVVWAIREGREAAREVDESLMGYSYLSVQ